MMVNTANKNQLVPLTLREIEADYEMVLSLLEEIKEDETIDSKEEYLNKYLDDLIESRKTKLDGYVKVIQQYQFEIELAQQQAASLLSKVKTKENKVRYLKERLLESLENHEIKKLKGQIHGVTLVTREYLKLNQELTEWVNQVETSDYLQQEFLIVSNDWQTITINGKDYPVTIQDDKLTIVTGINNKKIEQAVKNNPELATLFTTQELIHYQPSTYLRLS
jgi:ParB-like chromosome segregation protein Spo0J